MNPYFTPKAPEPKTGVVDIVIRSLMCAIVVLVIGVGIWMARDAMHKESVSARQTQAVGNGDRKSVV